MSLLSGLGNLLSGAVGELGNFSANNAQRQQTNASQQQQQNQSDWRVVISLAPNATYLYKAQNPGILRPLLTTGGVVFPYTPSITLNYKANYSPYDLTHANYKGYFYQSSAVDMINISGVFTAQDTNEADYLLAVIHFFRSASKMFYGQDAQRGTPPPLVYMSGMGPYQFNNHPCVISNFSYVLPADVDYIRAQTNANQNLNLTTQRSLQGVATNNLFGSIQRLSAALLPSGGIPNSLPHFGSTPNASPVVGQNSPTYVPTRMEISIQMYPMQTRQQISQQFSLQNFANGNLIRGGFW